MLEQSLLATLKHPLMGVGMGQFSNYVGLLGRAEGKTGAALHWAETHNAFTQVSSECGIPSFIFFVLGIVTAFTSVSRTYKRARRENRPDIANVCFCYLLSMIGFVVSIVFLANAYRFYLSVMIGLAIALSTIGERELSTTGVTLPTARDFAPRPVSTRPRLART